MSEELRLEDGIPCEPCGGLGVPLHGPAALCPICYGVGTISDVVHAPEFMERLLASRAREFRNLGDEAEDTRQAAELFWMSARIWEALARQMRLDLQGLAPEQVEVRAPGFRERLAQIVRLACLLYTAAGLSPWPCLMAFAKDLPRTGFAAIMTACRLAGARGFPHDARPGEPSPDRSALRKLFACGQRDGGSP